MPPLPATYPQVLLSLGVATVNADGRVREKKLIVDGLGWGAGDRTNAQLVTGGIVIRRVAGAGDCVDPRGQVLIPAGLRAMYDIATGTRVVLVASLERQVLLVHPVPVIAALVSEHYARHGVVDGY